MIHPLRDQSLISDRLDAVSEIVDTMGSIGENQNKGSFPGSGRGGGSIGSLSRGSNSKALLGMVLMALKKVPDIERGITRIFHGTANSAEVKPGSSSEYLLSCELDSYLLSCEVDSYLCSCKFDSYFLSCE